MGHLRSTEPATKYKHCNRIFSLEGKKKKKDLHKVPGTELLGGELSLGTKSISRWLQINNIHRTSISRAYYATKRKICPCAYSALLKTYVWSGGTTPSVAHLHTRWW
jgi:hypothetical protein